MEYFSYLDSITTYDARCTREIKSMIVAEQAAFNKKNLSTSKLELKFKEENYELLHLELSSFVVLKLGHFIKWIRNTWKVLKCGAGEGR